MRILALVTQTLGEEGGIGRFNNNFLTALAEMDKIRSIVVLSRGASAGEKFPPRVILKKSLKGKIGFIFSALWTFLTDGPFDLIFCAHINLAPLSAFLAKPAKIPFNILLYGIESWTEPGIFIRWAVKQASLIIAISRYTRRRFLTWSGVNPEKVKVLPPTVEEKFQPGPKPQYLLKRHGLVGKKVLLTVSRLSSKERYKGQDRVIDLIPNLLRKYPNLVYVIAGEGEDRSRLEKMAREKDVEKAIRFIGQIEESELVDLYRTADLFVMPSGGEGFGIVFLEAIACGIPVIGGNQDGSMDALAEGQLGNAVDISHPASLLTALMDGLNKTTQPFSPDKFSRNNFSILLQNIIENIGAPICQG